MFSQHNETTIRQTKRWLPLDCAGVLAWALVLGLYAFPAPTLAQGIECYRGPPYYWCPGDPPIGGGGGGGDGVVTPPSVYTPPRPRQPSPAEVKCRQALPLNEGGVALFSKGDYVAALKRFQRAHDLCPGNRTFGQNLSNARGRLNEQQAKEKAEKAFRLNEEGNALFENFDQIGAAAKYRDALKYDPNDKVIVSNLSRACRKIVERGDEVKRYSSGYSEHAMEYYKGGLLCFPNDKVILSKIVAMLNEDAKGDLRSGNYPDAIARYGEALELLPKDKIAQDGLAEALKISKIRPLQEALRIGELLKIANPSTSRAPVDTKRIIALIQQETEKYREALKIDPSNEDILIMLARSKEREGAFFVQDKDHASAIAAYREALALHPDVDSGGNVSRFALPRAEAEYAKKTGDLERAIEKYGECLKYRERFGKYDWLDKDSEYVGFKRTIVELEVAVTIRKGEALLNDRDLKGAKIKYDELIALDPTVASKEAISFRSNLVQAQVELAAALHRLGDMKGAVDQYRDALELDRSNESIRNELSRAESELQNQQARVSPAPSPTGVIGGPGGTAVFGTPPNPPNPNLGPAASDKTARVTSVIKQLESATASGTIAAGPGAGDVGARSGAECGFGKKPCEPAGQAPVDIPQPPPPVHALSPAASALVDRLAKNKQVMEDLKIKSYLDWYISLDQQETEKQARLATIQKEIDSGKGERQILDAEKGTLEHNIKDIKANKAKAETWMKTRVTVDLGATWPGEEVSPPSPSTAGTNSGATGPSIGAQPGPGPQQ